jgi:hypothetical protein
MALPDNLGEPPEPRQRIMQRRIWIRNRVATTALAENKVHLARIDEKASRDGLLEHPLQRYLG